MKRRVVDGDVGDGGYGGEVESEDSSIGHETVVVGVGRSSSTAVAVEAVKDAERVCIEKTNRGRDLKDTTKATTKPLEKIKSRLVVRPNSTKNAVPLMMNVNPKERRRSSLATVRRYDSDDSVVMDTLSPRSPARSPAKTTRSRMSIALDAKDIIEEIGIDSYDKLHKIVSEKYGEAAAEDARIVLKELHLTMAKGGNDGGGENKEVVVAKTKGVTVGTTAANASVSSASVSSPTATTKKSRNPEWPQSIEGYTMKNMIGRGSFAKVYRASCNRTLPKTSQVRREMVAVKVIATKSASVLSKIGELQAELNAMTKCRHPNILPLYQSFRSGVSSFVLVTPLMNMGSLSAIIRNLKRAKKRTKSNGLEEDWIRAILLQVTRGLAYMHQSGFLHRDIKPANILLNSSGVVKIADMGLAAYNVRKNSKNSTLNGTFVYMSPEVMMGGSKRKYTSKIDIWSLGITALELATSYAPYAHLRPESIIKRLFMGDVPSLLTYKEVHSDTGETLGTFSSAFHKFYKSALVQDPTKRLDANALLKTKFLSSQRGEPGTILKSGLVALLRRYFHEEDEGGRGKGHDDASSNSTTTDTRTSTPERRVRLNEGGGDAVQTSKESRGDVVTVKDVDGGRATARGAKLDPEAALLVDPTALNKQFSAVHRKHLKGTFFKDETAASGASTSSSTIDKAKRIEELAAKFEDDGSFSEPSTSPSLGAESIVHIKRPADARKKEDVLRDLDKEFNSDQDD
eukprot:g2295.t1